MSEPDPRTASDLEAEPGPAAQPDERSLQLDFEPLDLIAYRRDGYDVDELLLGVPLS